MAVLSKIRERSLFLILIIGMALFAFVASPKDIMSFFQSNKAGQVGSVGGESISQEEFTAQVKNIKAANPNIKDLQATEQVWNSIISEKIYASQLEKAGIVVGEKDIWEAIVSSPSIKNSPQFQNEAGLFNEESLKSYIADLEENKDETDGARQWASWIAYENSIKQGLERSAYLNLIKAGMGVTAEEAKQYYLNQNTKVSGKFIMLPFASIPDSVVSVSNSEIESYINAHKKQFKVKASRAIRYIKFDLTATAADKTAIETEIKALQTTLQTEKGENLLEFVENNSDMPLDNSFIEKKTLNPKVADTLFNLNIGDVYGPYEDKGYYKITKYIEHKEVNTAKASHILVSYKDAQNAKPEITRTKEEAKALAAKILRKVNKADIKKFAEEAKISSDGPSASRGGDLGTFAEGRMVPPFNDWVFSHKKGDVGMVETEFGFHIINLENTFSAKKFLTIAKVIEPSQDTEAKVFVDAEGFSTDVTKNKNFVELAKEKKYILKNGQNLSKRGVTVPGLKGNNAQIVSWAFEEEAKVGDVKRFDIDKAYIVAQITQKEEEGLQSVKSATAKVRPILINDKKAVILNKRLQDGTLSGLADKEGKKIQSTGEIDFSKPGTALLGKNKAVVGALLSMKEGETLRGVRGDRGVFMLELTKKNPPTPLDSYEPYRQQLLKKIRKDDAKIFEALKETISIEDYRQ